MHVGQLLGSSEDTVFRVLNRRRREIARKMGTGRKLAETEKKRRNREWQRAVEDMMRRNRNMKYEAATARVGASLHPPVSGKTVRRYVRRPGRK